MADALAASRAMNGETLTHSVSLGEAFRVWLRVALLSFGGPAGQIATMHRILVEEKRWVSDSRFLHALNYCMLLPGPEAQQLATYVGWLMHRTRGGLMAGGLFILPGVVALMALSIVYALWGQIGFVAAAFFGLKSAVLAIVVEALIRIGKRALSSASTRALAAGGVCCDLLLCRSVSHHYYRRRADRLFCRARRASGLCRRKRPWQNEHGLSRRKFARRGHPDHARPSAARAVRVAACLARTLARACRRPRRRRGRRQCLHDDRVVFQQDGARHFRRGLCGAGLCRAAGGRALITG